MEHRFGGNWTEIKLDCLRRYLVSYRQIFHRNERASYFKTWFVDAFAGTGSRVETKVRDESPMLFEDVYEDNDAKTYRDGSATIALGIDDPFHHYLFIERLKSRISALQTNLAKQYPGLVGRCKFEVGDANRVILDWMKARDWTKERAVVFLDPYGMQVEWRTVEMLGGTKAVDLWYLFPLGVGVSRMLTRDGQMDESWKTRLDSVLGTTSWGEEFYRPSLMLSLFPEGEQSLERTATPESIEAFVHRRLGSCFEGVAKGLVLRNSRSNPMYLLCFAAANKRGAPVALRIAQHLLGE